MEQLNYRAFEFVQKEFQTYNFHAGYTTYVALTMAEILEARERLKPEPIKNYTTKPKLIDYYPLKSAIGRMVSKTIHTSRKKRLLYRAPLALSHLKASPKAVTDPARVAEVLAGSSKNMMKEDKRSSSPAAKRSFDVGLQWSEAVLEEMKINQFVVGTRQATLALYRRKRSARVN